MALVGKLVLENFNYSVGETEFPLFENDVPLMDETGEQKTAKFKVINIEALPGTQIEIRVPTEHWDNFLNTLAEKPRLVPADLEDLRRATAEAEAEA